jgi:hypothetical protein
MTLNELSRRTNIRVSALAAIDRCDVTALPGGLYTRAFLRAYAREVGCDPEDIIHRYRTQCREHDLATDPMAQANIGIALACAAGQVRVAEIDAMTRRSSRVAWSGGLVVVFGAVAYVTGLSMTFSSPRLPEKPRSAELRAAPTARQSAAPNSNGRVGTRAAADEVPSDKPLTSVSGLQLELKPRGTCWVSASADGAEVLSRLMNVGDHAQVAARKEIVLRVGDPATCAFDINGAGTRQLGAAGKPMTVHLTPENIAEYLQP